MTATTLNKPQRYQSLDVLRGLTVTFMCMVNNPGTWGHMYPPMVHASWNGCTPADLIYPTFVFCMGCAMAFSLSKFEQDPKAAAWKVIKRSIAIFAVGFLLNWYPYCPTENGKFIFGWDNWLDWAHGKRIMGVLQRIACAYLLGGLLAIWLKKPKKIAIAIGALCVIYTGVLVLFGNEPGPFTLEGTVLRKIDVAILGETHVYHGYSYTNGMRAAFDPEGLFASLPAAASCLLGYLIGYLIRFTGKTGGNQYEMVSKIFVYGLVSAAFGEILNIWIPISKPMWSVSYVFYAGGWAMILLAFFIFCIDMKGIEKPFVPFKIMGMNPMVAFVLSALIVKNYQFVHFSPSTYFGANEFTSLLHSLLFACIILTVNTILYKLKIFIKV